MRTLLALAATLALLGIAAAPAGARSLETDYRLRGDVRVTWTTAAGERGSATQALLTRGSLDFEIGGSSSGSSSLSTAEAAVARVERDAPGGGREVCLDAMGTDDPSLDLEPDGRRTLLVGLRDDDGDPGVAAVSSGRCAGPIAQDLVGLLPITRVDLRRLRRRAVTADLRTRRPFAAGGISGTLVSTVTVRFGRARRSKGGDGGLFSVGRRRAAGAQDGTDARLDGALTTTFSGGDSLACRLLDACAVEGTSTLRLVDVEHMRGFDENEDSLRARAIIDARVRRPGAPDCVDHVELPVRLGFRIRSPAGGDQQVRLQVAEDNGEAPADLLRTRCTGPAADDLLGRVIASGETGPDGRVPLRAARRLRTGPFSGGQSGELVYSEAGG